MIFIYKRYQTLIILKDKMKYITLFMLICLFFTVKSEEELNDYFTKCTTLDEEECKEIKEHSSGYKCCRFKGTRKVDGYETDYCGAFFIEDYDSRVESFKQHWDDLIFDCSGKYLYVASFLMLLFVF